MRLISTGITRLKLKPSFLNFPKHENAPRYRPLFFCFGYFLPGGLYDLAGAEKDTGRFGENDELVFLERKGAAVFLDVDGQPIDLKIIESEKIHASALVDRP